VTAVIDVSDADFDREVLERSHELPVVVDFWAPWCGPCRALGPVLEDAVAALGGSVVLAKLNTDASPEVAQRYAIASIPAVKAFKDGAQVAEFIGARDARFVRAWLEEIAPSRVKQSLAEATAAGDEDALSALLPDPEVGAGAALALAALRVARGATDGIEALLDRAGVSDDASAIRRRLQFKADVDAYGGEARARAALAEAPDDLDARWALASALAVRGAGLAALDELLEIVRRSRKFKDDGARKAVVAILAELPDQDLAREYRRKLMILL
jgi:putative thioredoxin